MAGIHVSEKKNQGSEATVSNTVAYNLPFVVRGDSDSRPKAKLSLKQTSLEKLSSTQSSLDFYLSNEEATLLKESDFQAEIRNISGKVITTQSSKLDITPETKFIYPIKLPEKVQAGEYSVNLKVTHGKDNWEFNKKFTITGEQAKEIHQRSGIKNYSWIIYCIIIVAIIFIGLLFLFLRNKPKIKREVNNSSLCRSNRRKKNN
ncbi:WxL protein host-binding domain-containing protein [Lactococcus lactis]